MAAEQEANVSQANRDQPSEQLQQQITTLRWQHQALRNAAIEGRELVQARLNETDEDEDSD
ncbi:hypothetical protein LTR62_002360 [Meristemomyces frigidus]|uniref:Uncharacterized protein n=1 Tax=Meristemomyces frigidus TaxID=1508187 RepID=A0AAN7T7A9_9PEZI|nr:hypothetical protein LTR62_002360 [Meristemomyces frigidus]